MADALLLEAGVMFAAIAAVSFAAARLDVSPIPFYILAGVALNEFVLGRAGLPHVTDTAFVSLGAELGIVFLLFFLGIEFDPERLIADRARLGAAAVDFAVNFGVGLALGYLLFGSVAAGVVVAGVVYVSSSAVITKTMLDVGWIANPESAPILGTLVAEDLVVAVYLAVLSAAVLGGGSLGAAARPVAVAVGFLLLLALFVYLGTRALERMLATTSTEYFVLRAVGTTVLVAGAALSLGVSEAVAAFFVGMAFSSTSAVHELEETLSPLRDVFAAVFFFWIGLVTDPFAVLDVLVPLAAAVAVSVPTKLLSGFYGGRVYGLDDRRALRVGLGMVTRGEFSLIVAATALAGAGAALDVAAAEDIYALAVGYVLVMSVLGTALMQYAAVIERRLP
ncbi:MAG: cation:proton antiporter [Halarchaeum sp.]